MYDPWSVCDGHIRVTTKMWNSREQNIKLFISCILFNIHLWNQHNAQDTNVIGSVAFHSSYMLRLARAIHRETTHQISNLLVYKGVSLICEQECHNSKFGIFETLVKKQIVCRCTFNRYSCCIPAVSPSGHGRDVVPWWRRSKNCG